MGARARAPGDTMTNTRRTNIFFFLLFTHNPKRGRVPPRDAVNRESAPGLNTAVRSRRNARGGGGEGDSRTRTPRLPRDFPCPFEIPRENFSENAMSESSRLNG